MKAILFDLGNTLVSYYRRYEFPDILKQAIINVNNFLFRNECSITDDHLWQAVKEEDYESVDNRVRPLEERLLRIFKIEARCYDTDLLEDMSRCFMKPIFDRSVLYDDVLPTLKEIKKKGVKTAIVSNTSWGSPAKLWREEIMHLGLDQHIDEKCFAVMLVGESQLNRYLNIL